MRKASLPRPSKSRESICSSWEHTAIPLFAVCCSGVKPQTCCVQPKFPHCCCGNSTHVERCEPVLKNEDAEIGRILFGVVPDASEAIFHLQAVPLQTVHRDQFSCDTSVEGLLRNSAKFGLCRCDSVCGQVCEKRHSAHAY